MTQQPLTQQKTREMTIELTLVALRKLAIRRQSKIRFTLRNGMECVVSEDGVARVPALKGVPDFNLEQELAAATAFEIEAVVPAGKAAVPAGRKNAPKPVSLGRPEMAAMALDSPASVAAHDQHDDE
jgi:hypothetical protein